MVNYTIGKNITARRWPMQPEKNLGITKINKGNFSLKENNRKYNISQEKAFRAQRRGRKAGR